ncbi:MAG: lipopolysaccharide biosynthesis protein [Planctomycetota bacterium]|nr:lipopolysaccharide biosynthesis protein [Planctomycetota bacterium]
MEYDPPALGDRASGDLPARAARGSAIGIASQAAKFLLQFGATAALARLLHPRDYGIAALVTSVTAGLGIFSDLGLSAATVQAKELGRARLSTLFWLNAALGLALSLVLAGLAPLLAWGFREPDLLGVALCLAPVFTLVGLRIQHAALLARSMSFGKIAAAELTAACAGIAAGILAALRGWGVYALVAQALAATAVESLLYWIFAAFRPGLPARGSGVGSMLRFGGHLTVFDLMNYAARNLDNLLVGGTWGPEALGYYSRAYALMTLPLQALTAPLSRVMVPALSRMQDDPARMEHAYVRTARLLAFATFPLSAGTFVLAEEAIALVLGAQWSGAVPVLRALAVAGLLQPVLSSTGWIYVARGDTRRLLRWNLFAVPVTVASFLVGLPWGPRGVSLAYAAVFAGLVAPAGLWCSFRRAGFRLLPFLKFLALPLLFSAVMGAGVWLAKTHLLPEASAAVKAAALIPAGGALYAALCWFACRPLFDEALALAGLRRRP